MKANNNYNSQLIRLNNEEYLQNLRIAGKVSAQALILLEKSIKSGVTSLKDLEKIGTEFILSHNGCLLTFKNYRGFPDSFCISINSELVHGTVKDYNLKNGDLITIDLGVTYNKSISDTAFTMLAGEAGDLKHTKLVQTTKECLTKAIDSIEVGKKLGCIGNTIYNHAKSNGFNVIEQYSGHFIGIIDGQEKPHMPPAVLNKADINSGLRIQIGSTIAIEPLLCIGDTSTRVLNDNWTVEMVDKNMCSHEEHTVYVHENYVEIISDREKYAN